MGHLPGVIAVVGHCGIGPTDRMLFGAAGYPAVIATPTATTPGQQKMSVAGHSLLRSVATHYGSAAAGDRRFYPIKDRKAHV